MMRNYDDSLRLLAARYPDFPMRSVEPMQQGWDSVTLLVNGDTVFRFARRPGVEQGLAREARLLPRLAPTLPVAVPRFTYVGGDPASGAVAFVGYPLLPGAPLALDGYLPSQVDALVGRLGAFLSALHAFPTAEAAALGVPGGGAAEDWRDEYAALYADFRAHCFALLDERERARAAALWEDYLDDAENFAFSPALIHRDLSPEHLLRDPATATLTGVIDWGDASIGDPAHDFTGITRAFGRPFAERVLAGYAHPAAESFWRRVAFYGAIVPFYAIRFGQLSGDEGYIAHGLELLRSM